MLMFLAGTLFGGFLLGAILSVRQSLPPSNPDSWDKKLLRKITGEE